MSDVKWIKLATDFFGDQKIEMIEGDNPEIIDSLLVIWIKLMVQAGKDNNGGVFALDNGKPYSIKNFASLFHRPEKLVKTAIDIFMEYGMIEKDGDTYYLPKWERYQSQDAYERKKERDKIYQQKRREAQKAAESTKDEEIPTEEVKAPKKAKKDDVKTAEMADAVIDYLNQKAGTKFRASTAQTKTLIHARLVENKDNPYTLEDFKVVIDNKCSEWLGDAKMEKYLRPATLFGTKFESYLNEKHERKATGVGQGTEDELDKIF